MRSNGLPHRPAWSRLLQGLGVVYKTTELAQMTPEVQSEQAPVFSNKFG